MADFNLNGANLGQDATVTLSVSTGGSFQGEDLGHLMSITADQGFETETLVPCTGGGQPVIESTPGPVKVMLDYARTSGALGQLISDYCENHRNGVRPIFQMQLLVTNRNTRAVDTYQFTNGKPSDGSLGAFTGAKKVDQKLHLTFSKYVVS